MNKLINKQKGLSIINFLFVMVGVVLIAIVGMKVVPMYLEYNSVKKALDGASNERFESVAEARESIMKRFSINYVETLQKEDVIIKQQNGKYNISVDYYVDKPLVANLSISAHFQYEVTTK